MSIEAMKQALEALELCNGAETADGIVIYTDKEITSLRQAIAEAEKQEPVAWMHKQGNYEEPSFRQLDDDEISRAWEQYPLYTHPQPATQCEFIRHTKEGTHWCALAEKSADWVGLTSQDVHECFNLTEFDHHVDFNRDPEQWCLVFAKELSDTLKQKNGYEEKNT